MNRSIHLVVVAAMLLHNGIESFHIPLLAAPGNGGSSSRFMRSTFSRTTMGPSSHHRHRFATRWQASTKDYTASSSSSSRHFLAATGSNSTTASSSTSSSTCITASTTPHHHYEREGSSYAMMLQTFLDDAAASHDEALRDFQSLHDNRNTLTIQNVPSMASNGGGSVAMVAALKAPSIDQDEESAANNNELVSSSSLDTRDEDDLWRARLLLVGAAALYGTNFSLVKLLGETMPVGISSALRFGLAALATLPWLIDAKIFNDKTAQKAALLGLEVGMWNSIGYVAQAVGLETTLASKSAFICSMAVVIVPLLEFMTGKKLLARQWVGALMALVGVAFLELGGGDGVGDAIASLTTGDAVSMIQPIMFGIGFWKMEKAMHECPEEARRLTAAQLMAVFLGSATYGLYSMGDAAHAADASISMTTFASSCPWKEWLTDPSILFSLFWTGCITTALTIYMETMALETLSATETTLIFSTEPLWGTAFAAAVMGEQLGMNAGVGAFFILAACLYSNLGVQGLANTWRSGTTWLNQQVMSSSSTSSKTNSNSQQLPLWQSVQERWSWIGSSLATSLATWNVATSNLTPQELNDIVDDLVDKLS